MAVVMPPPAGADTAEPIRLHPPTRSSARGIMSENPAGVTTSPCKVRCPPATSTAHGKRGGLPPTHRACCLRPLPQYLLTASPWLAFKPSADAPRPGPCRRPSRAVDDNLPHPVVLKPEDVQCCCPIAVHPRVLGCNVGIASHTPFIASCEANTESRWKVIPGTLPPTWAAAAPAPDHTTPPGELTRRRTFDWKVCRRIPTTSTFIATRHVGSYSRLDHRPVCADAVAMIYLNLLEGEESTRCSDRRSMSSG